MENWIQIYGARENNLKNVDLKIPRGKFVVLTGLSGSGKSSLAFDTLQRECQRQYMESMGLVTDFVSKPKVQKVVGLSPSISVDQRLNTSNPRSTVGTTTEVFTYLRLLYARLGERPCPSCKASVKPTFETNDGANLWEENDQGSHRSCPRCHASFPDLTMAHFSFNKPEGACPTCKGLGVVNSPNLDLMLDESLSINQGAVLCCWDANLREFYANALTKAGDYYGFRMDLDKPVHQLPNLQRELLLYGVSSTQFSRHFKDLQPPTSALNGRFEGIITTMLRNYAKPTQSEKYREKIERFLTKQSCPDCNGTRLNKASRQVVVAGHSITELASLSFFDLHQWIQDIQHVIAKEANPIVAPIIADLEQRIKRLIDVGVGYLALVRPTASLSGGEAQRLRLASLLGSGLTGVLYVLDEPTIGLHPRDTHRLISFLRRLRDLGNTVLVIEHDLDVIQAADYLIDIGPGAGKKGGEIVATGLPQEIAENPQSITGQYLSRQTAIPLKSNIRRGLGEEMTIVKARAHNLKDITVSIPLGVLTAVTGVSGSGKSSLLFSILDPAARRKLHGGKETPGPHQEITGFEHLDKMITIDQSPIGRTPRSNPATYTDTFKPIRELFAKMPQAKQRGLTARSFSFNVPGGRCDKCEGAGFLTIEMHFLPEAHVSCPACRGKRFKQDVLEVKYKGHNISDVLQMTIAEALELFVDEETIRSKLSLMADVGLEYLQLGQAATTLSGGEAQRIKLAKELSKKSRGHTLYLLDEPTTGLHIHDVKKLLAVLERLVDAGNSVIVIEHNVDIIKNADHVIELGPEGGEAGGYLVAYGTPQQICEAPSITGKYLNSLLSS